MLARVAWMLSHVFFGDDQKRNVRKCGVKVACIHFGDELKYKNIKKMLDLEGCKCQTKLLEEVVALTELTLNCRDRVRVYLFQFCQTFILQQENFPGWNNLELRTLLEQCTLGQCTFSESFFKETHGS